MKRKYDCLSICLLSCFLMLISTVTHAQRATAVRKVINIDKDWAFHKGPVEQQGQARPARALWQKVDLPHDWRIHEPYDKDNPRKNGYLPTGVGWYLKHLDLKGIDKKDKVFIEFDGVFRNSTVWVNGHKVGTHLSGYTGFVLDITDFLDFNSQSNKMKVYVDNAHANPNIAAHPWSEYGPGHEGWWYEGYGIYRHVHMIITRPIHVATWGTFVYTKTASKEKAGIRVNTTIANQSPEQQKITVETSIRDASGRQVASLRQFINTRANADTCVRQSLEVLHPDLWSPDRPYLYNVVTKLYKGKALTDQYTTPLGIRWFKFTADSGFYLNGKRLQLRGMNIHADYGGLGTALPDRANYKDIEIAKKMGVNIIRSAHNDPSVALMRACDEQGMLLWVETRYLGKDSFALGSIDDMIRRDRNHPSIICWGLANNSGRNDPRLTTFLKVMNARAKENDSTRPTVFGCEANGDPNKTGFAFVTDVMGYNGGGMGRDDPDHQHFPERKMLISEYSSGMGARGIYKKAVVGYPVFDTLGDGRVFQRTGSLASIYDLCRSHEQEWSHIATRSFLAGGIMWSGIEYLGEPTGWPVVTSQFGVLDIARFKKDAYYYYLQEWTKKPMVHIFPHWNWKKGDSVKVWSYSNQDAVELFLNGKTLGIKKRVPLGHMQWNVPFEPGLLTAVAYKNGKKTATTFVRTAGNPSGLQLGADRELIKADGCDLSFITIDITDARGTVVPDADNLIRVQVKGGKLLGLCSGNPESHADPSGPSMAAFNGKLLAIIQSDEKTGKIEVKASAAGLAPQTLMLTKK